MKNYKEYKLDLDLLEKQIRDKLAMGRLSIKTIPYLIRKMDDSARDKRERKCPHCGTFPLVLNAGRRLTSDISLPVCSVCKKKIREKIKEVGK